MTDGMDPVDSRARWKVIYGILGAKSIGSLVTYDELGDALDLDPVDDRHAIQMGMRRAAQEYLTVDLRAVEAEPNRGYRVVQAEEQLRLAQRHQKRAANQLVAGHAQVVHVDLSGMEPATRHAFEVVARAFTAQLDFNRRLDVRQSRLEEALRQLSAHTTRSDEELADLRARLDRLDSN